MEDQQSPFIMKPATPPSSSESRPSRKSPATTTAPTQYFHIKVEEEYPLHENVRDLWCHLNEVKRHVRAARLHSKDKNYNVDQSVFFVYHRDNKHWTLVKGPTSMFHDESWYEYPPNTQRRDNVAATSWRCSDVVTTLLWRCVFYWVHRTAPQESHQTEKLRLLVRLFGAILQCPLKGEGWPPLLHLMCQVTLAWPTRSGSDLRDEDLGEDTQQV